MTVRDIRTDYSRGELNEASVGDDPFRLFAEWIQLAVSSGQPEPNAMSVSTVSRDMRPSSRILLLRHYGPDGFHFYTNYRSRKAADLDACASVALLFFWPQLERQVRIEGTAARLSAAESDRYFNARPYESRLGAVASDQSCELSDRSILEKRMDDLRKEFPDEVPRPEHWGGYNVVPSLFEFWQGRPGRLHDRFQFELSGPDWNRRRLFP